MHFKCTLSELEKFTSPIVCIKRHYIGLYWNNHNRTQFQPFKLKKIDEFFNDNNLYKIRWIGFSLFIYLFFEVWAIHSFCKIINSYWKRLSKISWFVCGELINYRLWQIIDLRDTDNSRYFAITEFNNCFIIRSPSLYFLIGISPGSEAICHFHARAIARRRKASFLYACAEYCLQLNTLKPNTVGRHCAWADLYL